MIYRGEGVLSVCSSVKYLKTQQEKWKKRIRFPRNYNEAVFLNASRQEWSGWSLKGGRPQDTSIKLNTRVKAVRAGNELSFRSTKNFICLLDPTNKITFHSGTFLHYDVYLVICAAWGSEHVSLFNWLITWMIAKHVKVIPYFTFFYFQEVCIIYDFLFFARQ